MSFRAAAFAGGNLRTAVTDIAVTAVQVFQVFEIRRGGQCSQNSGIGVLQVMSLVSDDYRVVIGIGGCQGRASGIGSQLDR